MEDSGHPWDSKLKFRLPSTRQQVLCINAKIVLAKGNISVHKHGKMNTKRRNSNILEGSWRTRMSVSVNVGGSGGCSGTDFSIGRSETTLLFQFEIWNNQNQKCSGNDVLYNKSVCHFSIEDGLLLQLRPQLLPRQHPSDLPDLYDILVVVAIVHQSTSRCHSFTEYQQISKGDSYLSFCCSRKVSSETPCQTVSASAAGAASASAACRKAEGNRKSGVTE